MEERDGRGGEVNKKKGKGANVLSDISRGRVVELSDGCESHYCL